MQTALAQGNDPPYTLSLNAAYTWDNQGRMTSLDDRNFVGGGQYQYQYDAMGRLGGMTLCTQYDQNGNCTYWGTTATAGYGVANQVTSLSYGGYSETRTYNSLLQLTRITTMDGGTTVMDMQYVFSGTQNNGRITQSIYAATGQTAETVSYTYDSLNRLVGAAANTWGEAYAYDGYGNLTTKTPTYGTAPTLTTSYDWATNHEIGQGYDANGNTGSGTRDVENRVVLQGSANVGTT